MGVDYIIKIKLYAEYTKENITKILNRGAQRGFIYYDHIFGEKYDDAEKIDAPTATNKIINAHEKNLEGGPSVYTHLDNESSVHLWFIKDEQGFLELRIGAFNSPKKKGYYLDFAYYLKIFLDLCEDFTIIHVKAEMDSL